MSDYKHFFLLTRPYSYASEVARAILFVLILSPVINTTDLFLSVTLALLMWFFYNWSSDSIQQDPGRLKVPIFLILVPLFITIIISYIVSGLLGLTGVLIYSCTILLYSLKTKNKYFGLLGPFFRFLTIIGFSVFICCIFKTIPNLIAIQIVILVAFLKLLRNFIGDVRDIETDKWEFPARYGPKLSGYVVVGLIFISLFSVLFMNLTHVKISLFVFIILLLAIVIIIFKVFGINNGRIWGYILHYIMVIWFPIFQLIIGIEFNIPYIWIFSIFVLLLLTPLYNNNPGKKYPTLKELKYLYNTRS